MQVVRHDNKFVEEIGALIPTSDDPSNQNLRKIGRMEERAILPSLRGHEVSAGRSRPMLELSHLNFRG